MTQELPLVPAPGRVPLPAVEACETCRFFAADEYGRGGGCCRRNPPAFFPGPDAGSAGFPSARADWWCGEYRAAGAVNPSAELPEWEEFRGSFSVRLGNVFRRAEVVSWQRLLAPDFDPTEDLRHFGNTSYRELLALMKRHGVPVPAHWPAARPE